MRQYLVEGATGAFPFIVDRTKPFVSESRPDGVQFTRIPGRFSVCDCVNGNNRRYSKQVWEKNLSPGSVLQESIKRNAAFGLLEHPKDGVVTLLSPISHHVTEAKMVKSVIEGKEVWEVYGQIEILNTSDGQKLKALIEGGYNPLVSSRGYGSLKKASDGVDDVDDDYVCEGWDTVIKPSFENAELQAQLSRTNAQMAAPVALNPTAESVKVVTEAVPPASPAASPTPTLKEQAAPSSGSPASESKAQNRTDNIMQLNEISGRITTLESLEPTKLDPTRFAETMQQIESLHQAIAENLTDPKQSWEAQKLHRKLDSLTHRYSESAQAPAKRATKLAENNIKLMKVVNAVASTAVGYKKKLGESLKSCAKQVSMTEELIRRGQGWQKLAESRKEKYAVLEKDFNTACEALDHMADRYHQDVTELARRVIQLEFKEKAQTPEIQKLLKEATRLRHVVAVRETLEGKKSGKAVNENEPGVGKPADGEAPGKEAIKDEKQKKAGSPDEGKVAEEPGKVKNESKPASKAEGKDNKVSESKQAGQQASSQIVLSERDPRGLQESIELVKRLSGAPAK